MTTDASFQNADIEVASSQRQGICDKADQEPVEKLSCEEDIEEINKSANLSTCTLEQQDKDKTNAADCLPRQLQQGLKCKNQQPNISWMQSEEDLSLRIHIRDIETFKLSVTDSHDRLVFEATTKATTVEANDRLNYHIELNFFSKVDKKLIYCKHKRHVLVVLEKVNRPELWPSLTKNSGSDPDWIQLEENEFFDDLGDVEDYDEFIGGIIKQLKQWEHNSSDDPKKRVDKTSCEDQAYNLKDAFTDPRKTQEDIFDPFKRRRGRRSKVNMKYDYRKESNIVDSGKNTARQAMDYKKTYLFIYNLMMFVVFLMVNIILIIKSVSGTMDDDSVRGAAFIIKVLTYTQLLESVHPMLGLVPGGPLMPFIQVIGRLLVNLFLSQASIRMDSAPYAHYLFIVWSSIEIFRYSFYSLRVFKVDIPMITWCRYTLFMPLYPMGGFCESMVILSTIKFYEKTGAYSISLPNSANFSFSLPVALRIYVFILLWPTIYMLMKYMWSQRCRQLKEKVA